MAEIASARSRFQQKVREIVNDRDQFVAKDVTEEALAAMRAEDPGFDEAFTNELAGLMAYESTLQEVGKTRQRSIFATGRRTRRQTTTTVGERLMGWMEHAGDRHVRTREMLRPVLRQAAGIRKGRGLRELLVSTYWTRLADAMPDDITTVGQHFTPDQIEAIWRETIEPDELDSGVDPTPLLPSP